MTVQPDLIRLSPNFNNAALAGGRVIIHATRSTVSMNPSEYPGTINHMMTPGTTSSQWVIGREANQKARIVPDNKQAWHAQEDNALAWAIELAQGVESDGFTSIQIEQLVAVCKDYVAAGVPPIHVSGTDQLGFVGHEETVQGRRNGKSDPGSGFPWEAFIAALKEEDMALTPEDHEVVREIVRRMPWQADGIDRNTQQMFEKVAELQNRIIELEKAPGDGVYTDADARKAIKDRL